jgi:hypothetical protein
MRRLLLIAMLALPSLASACMVCDTELGHQVQRGVFDGNFTRTAVAVLLPFPFFILAGAAVHFGAAKLMAPSKNQPAQDTQQ